MTRIQIAKNPSGQLSVAFAYDPLLATNIKTIPGHPNDDLATGTLNSILKQAELKDVKWMYRFLVVIEKANGNYPAYSLDLPGCIATGATRQKTENNMHEAIELHVQGLLEDNLPIPESNSFAEYVAVQ